MTQLAHDDGDLEVRARPDGGPSGGSPDWARGHNGVDIEADQAHVAMCARLRRVIESAPVQNKLAVFGMMARRLRRSRPRIGSKSSTTCGSLPRALALLRCSGSPACRKFLRRPSLGARHERRSVSCD